MSKKLIAVGDSAEIELIFASGSIKGSSTKAPEVYTSDVLNSMMKLVFTAYVYPEDVPTSPFVAMPNKLSLNVGDDERKHNITFKNITMDSLRMKLAWADDVYLNVEVPDRPVGPGEKLNVVVEINPRRHQVKFESSFTIQASDKGNTRITVPVVFGREYGAKRLIKNK